MSFYPDFATYNANANVRPARLLVRHTTESIAIEAVGLAIPFIGVSNNRFKLGAPNSFESQAVPNIAVSGDSIDYFGRGQIAYALAGAAISSLVLPVTSDGSGRAITASVTAAGVAYYVGYPLNTVTAANELVRIQIDPGFSST